MKTIALTMIARNEERCIERALVSARPWVDKLLVLDTGSTDRTIEIARDCGAEVFERRWTDDFAAARNAILTRSTADYNLILDADEWIEYGGPAIASVRANRTPLVHALQICSSLQAEGSDIQSYHWVTRLLPRGVRYRGRVHEQPHHRLKISRLDVKIGHDGYAPANMLAKRGRNRALLEQTLAETPDDPYTLYQMGKDHDAYREIETAIDYFRRALAVVKPSMVWRHDLIVRMLLRLPMAGDLEGAMMLAADEMANWGHSADFHYAAAEVMFAQFQAHPGQGAQLLPMIEHCLTTALKLGDTLDLSGAMAGRGSYLAAEKLWVLYKAKGDHERADQFDRLREQMHQEHKDRQSRLDEVAIPIEV